MRNLWMVVLTGVTLLVSGCATGPKYNTVENGLTPLANDKARIYFFRSTTLGGAIQPEIRLNGVVVGTAEPNGVFFVDRNPGMMEVSTSSEVEKRLTFTVGASEKRYVRLAVGFGLLVYRIIPELVDEAEAKMEIAELAYTGGRRPPR